MASQIRFEPQGVDGLVASGTSIAAAAERLGVHVELRCGGAGECTSCAVRIVDGPFSLSPLTDAEKRMLSEADVVGSLRLGCQAKTGDAECTVHVLDAAERPPMPEGAAAGQSQPDESADRDKAGDRAKSAGWFGLDPWSWKSAWGTGAEGGQACGAGASDEKPTDESAGTESDIDDIRRRILEAFGELPAGERLATALELNLKAAGDFFGTVFEDSFKAGNEALDSLMKQAASVVREAKKRDASPSVPSETAVKPDEPTDDQTTDRP